MRTQVSDGDVGEAFLGEYGETVLKLRDIVVFNIVLGEDLTQDLSG